LYVETWRATEAYQNYLKTQPNRSAQQNVSARSLVAQNQFDAAEALLGPDQPGATPTLDTLKLRADIQIGQKKWDAAAVTLKQALALAPQDAKCAAASAAFTCSSAITKTPNSN